MDIVEGLIARPGQSQEQRLPVELGAHFADVEERRTPELYKLLYELSATVRFISVNGAGTAVADDGNWQPFFPKELLVSREGGSQPHLALLAAFLKLYRIPRCAMNGITARHMDFLYRRVLGFAPHPARPDRAHVILELKKGAQPFVIGPTHTFSGGKDKSGVELVYAPEGETVVNVSKVERLCSVFVDAAAPGRLYFAPKADSADGLGGKLEGPEFKWRPFGGLHMPPAQVGFALASPVLRMREGTRRVSIELDLQGAGAPASDTPKNFLECFITGETRWLGPYEPEGTVSSDSMSLSFTVPESHEAVVDYDAAVHGHTFATGAPVVQVLIKADHQTIGYGNFSSLTVNSARLEVDVAGVKPQLENDFGPLDARRAFQPFGPQPNKGSRFLIGCPEALDKNLLELKLDFNWLAKPSNLHSHYEGYKNPPAESEFTATVDFEDSGSWKVHTGRQLFGGADDWVFSSGETDIGKGWIWPGRGNIGVALTNVGTNWARGQVTRELQRNPKLGALLARPPKPRPGLIVLKLNRSFLHTEYHRLLLSAGARNEPYTPTLTEFSLAYRASSGTTALGSTNEEDFATADVQFLHVDCFGQRREHGYLRKSSPHASGTAVPLVAIHEDAGELLIGLSGLEPRDGVSVNLLFQVADGSADPDAPKQEVSWAVLCDNYWKPLADADAVQDRTNGLLTSGLIGINVPREATLVNTLLPAGLLWLKASVPVQANAVCSLIAVAANGVEVVRRAAKVKATRDWQPLPAKQITRLKTPVAAVKALGQPFASLGGQAEETPLALRRRAAERLRHRNRCITTWDYERAVLEAFPQVRKVKCIPHSLPGGPYLAPGHVLVAVVPDLRNRHAVDPLQPRVDAATLRDIEDYLRQRAGMQVQVEARNPSYQRIQLDFKVKFNVRDFNYHARILREALVNHLSPWMHDPGSAIEFGGSIHKSVLLDFVEDLDYVDFVTDFRIHNLRGEPQDSIDVDEVRAATPDAILVSNALHEIAEVA